jgi:hypothetical protein
MAGLESRDEGAPYDLQPEQRPGERQSAGERPVRGRRQERAAAGGAEIAREPERSRRSRTRGWRAPAEWLTRAVREPAQHDQPTIAPAERRAEQQQGAQASCRPKQRSQKKTNGTRTRRRPTASTRCVYSQKKMNELAEDIPSAAGIPGTAGSGRTRRATARA